MICPWRASDGAVRKNRPLSSAVERPGLVAEGEIITIPFGTATLARIAPVAPEHIAPTMPATPSEVTTRSPTAVAAAASMQVESPRTGSTVVPSRSRPLSDTSDIAISAPAAIAGASDSSGPVKPSTTPRRTASCACAAGAAAATASVAAEAMRMRFIMTCLPAGSLSARDDRQRAGRWEAPSVRAPRRGGGDGGAIDPHIHPEQGEHAMPLDRLVLILVVVVLAAMASVWLAAWVAASVAVPLGWALALPLGALAYVVWRVVADRLAERRGDRYDRMDP